MTQKRKAALQRKLSMAPVAKPPSDLADRIKGDIPEYLDTRNDRERLSRSLGFSLRVAASIILVVTSAFLAVDMMSRGDDVAVAPPPAAKAAAPQQVAEAVPQESRDEVDQLALKDERRQEKRALESHPKPQRTLARENIAAAPPPVAAVPPAPAPPPEPAARMAEAESAAAAAADSGVVGGLADAGFRARMDAAQKSVSVGNRVKTMLQKGEAPATADVRALVDHFAGPPPATLGEVRLDVEASRAPVSETDTAVIRYTIDMPSTEVGRRVVTPVKVTIALEKADFQSGQLHVRSYIRPNRLFTAEQSVVLYTAASLTRNKLDEVLQKLRQLFS